jgi:hypothetical protein
MLVPGIVVGHVLVTGLLEVAGRLDMETHLIDASSIAGSRTPHERKGWNE